MANNKTILVAPTADDLNNASIYAFERNKLQTYNWALFHFPKIFSEVHVEIQPHHYLMSNNKSFRDNCIYVRLKSSKGFCEKARCNLFFPRGQECTKFYRDQKNNKNNKNNTNPELLQIFKTAHTTDTACEAGCFKLFDTPMSVKNNNHEEEKDILDQGFRVLTGWSDRCDSCLIFDNSLYSMEIDDYNRTSKHTTRHYDTVGTGYDKANNFVAPSGDESFGFQLTEFDCQDFDMYLYEDEKKQKYCEYSNWEKYTAGFILGESLWGVLKRGIKATVETFDHDYNRPHLPIIGKQEKEELLKKFGTSNDNGHDIINLKHAFFIDPFVTLSQLGFTEKNMHMFWTTEHDDFGGGLKEPLYLYKSVDDIQPTIPHYLQRNNEENYKKNPMNLPNKRHSDEYEILNLKPTRITEETYTELFQAILNEKANDSNLLSALKSFAVEGSKFIAIDLTLRLSTKKILPKVIESLGTNRLTNFAFRATIKHVFQKEIEKEALKLTFEKAAARALSFGVRFIKAVDILLWVFLAIDLLLAFFDPLGIKLHESLGVQAAVDMNSKLNIMINQHDYGYGTVEFSPIYYVLAARHIHAENVYTTLETIQIKKNMFKIPNKKYALPLNATIPNDNMSEFTQNFYRDYLENLKFNSNGSKITVFDHSNEKNEILDKKEMLNKINFLNSNLFNYSNIKNTTTGMLQKLQFISIFASILILPSLFNAFVQNKEITKVIFMFQILILLLFLYIHFVIVIVTNKP